MGDSGGGGAGDSGREGGGAVMGDSGGGAGDSGREGGGAVMGDSGGGGAGDSGREGGGAVMGDSGGGRGGGPGGDPAAFGSFIPIPPIIVCRPVKQRDIPTLAKLINSWTRRTLCTGKTDEQLDQAYFMLWQKPTTSVPDVPFTLAKWNNT